MRLCRGITAAAAIPARGKSLGRSDPQYPKGKRQLTKSLRQLWLSGASPPEYATGTKAASLRRFRALHALRVPLSWLVFFETDWRAEYQPDGYVPGRAYELLPPGLEELQLELDVRLVMEENPAAFVREQTRYVREIVDAKPTWTPRLRRLLLCELESHSS